MDATMTETVSRKVEAALALDEVSIDYRVEMRPDEAREFCRRAPAYNGFTEDDLTRLIDQVGEAIPPMEFGGTNPNNGKPHHRFHVGNEGSRVIYLDVDPSYFRTFRPGEDSPWHGEAVPTFEGLEGLLGRYAEVANADEFTATRESDVRWTFRFWWD